MSDDEVTLEDVFGMALWRAAHPSSIPPAILCLSKEARGRNRRLAANALKSARLEEQARREARDAGNPRAFFGAER
jgi:hypothetical protein